MLSVSLLGTIMRYAAALLFALTTRTFGAEASAPTAPTTFPTLVADFDCAKPAAFPAKQLARLASKAVAETPEAVATWGERAISVDLNRDGKPEYIVPLRCGATGNCSWGIFAVDPVRSLGNINGARIYIMPVKAGWSEIWTYSAVGAGDGYLVVSAFRNDGYLTLSSSQLPEHENDSFLDRMGQPQCSR